jgi:hypothetical protein
MQVMPPDYATAPALASSILRFSRKPRGETPKRLRNSQLNDPGLSNPTAKQMVVMLVGGVGQQAAGGFQARLLQETAWGSARRPA